MKNRSEITHKGKIIEITAQTTSVQIISESACAQCHAKGLCASADSKEKIIQLPTKAWEQRSVGDEVTLVMGASMGHKAVFIGYIIPLVLLVGGILAGGAAGLSEIPSALLGFALTAIWYLVVYLMRNTLRNEFIFSIK